MLILASAAGLLIAASCEPWCAAPCADLNGNVRIECGSCTAEFTCRPGVPDFDGNRPALTQALPDGTASLDYPLPPEWTGATCVPFRRQLGHLVVCPILNGIWTSFLDHEYWGSGPLPQPVRDRIANEMLRYDDAGLEGWVGEDFDDRVLSALERHAMLMNTSVASRNGEPAVTYTIIVEEGRHVRDNVAAPWHETVD